MKRLITYCLMVLLCCCLYAADNTVKNLQKQQRQLKQEIEQTNKMLKQTKKNETATVTKLQLINQNIATQKKLINSLGKEISSIDDEINTLNRRRDTLEQTLESLKADYARIVRETHYAHLQQSPLLFILASQNFQQLVRRIRYLQEFARYRHEQAARIEGVKTEINTQNTKLTQHKSDKQHALKTQKREQEALARDERKQQQMLKDLQKKEKELTAQLKKQQKKVDDLNKKITATIEKQTKEQAQVALTKEQQLISGNFEQNKGRLPWPIEKGFISGQFGKHQHPVYKDVTIDNKGIYLQTTAGAGARAVFEGQVTSCFLMNGSYAVIVAHGNYRSVYAGLSRLNVKQGDKVIAKQKIGTIFSDPEQDNKTELFFQIWKDKTILNPSSWLAN
ncbi:MAG: peptidoglycan DD-metalloendopeptidase family protein [Paludibacteraceae bacterium]|nr:peptidoglycan DD-metalloendopeptidase family protein [Paludibacteraceae bacterium]